MGLVLALPTEQQVIDAFQKQGRRPSARVFSAWTGGGAHCGCALAVYAQSLGHQISNPEEAIELFGLTAQDFMLGWDHPDCLYHVEHDGTLYHNPVGEQGARCWWACVEAGLVPIHSEIQNSDIRYAPDWWRGVKYAGPVSARFTTPRY